jgi:hypothetical protein
VVVAPDPGSHTRDIREGVAAARIFCFPDRGGPYGAQAQFGQQFGPFQMHVSRLIARALALSPSASARQQDRSVIAAPVRK